MMLGSLPSLSSASFCAHKSTSSTVSWAVTISTSARRRRSTSSHSWAGCRYDIRPRHPLGLPRRAVVRGPSTLIAPVDLRAGDHFRAYILVRRRQRKAIYPRVNARAASFRITARSDGLSTSELTKLLNQLRADLEALRA